MRRYESEIWYQWIKIIKINMNNDIKYIITFLYILILTSCQKSDIHSSYSLYNTNDSIGFILDNDTKSSIMTMFPYIDKDGTEYLTFQNPNKNDILFYDLSSKTLKFKISPEINGPDGVGFFFGYYIHNLDSIFLTARSTENIPLINSKANVIDKYNYKQTADSINLSRFYSTTAIYTPIIFLDHKIYIVPGCNRWQNINPVSAYIDLKDKNVYHLPFKYPTFPNAINKNKRAGIEEHMSRCFDGNRFIYSFYFDEYIYVASINHKEIKRIKAGSRYIKNIEYIDDFGRTSIEKSCELANYGNLIYDKYRNVYYRIAYPKTEIEKDIKGYELREYGRKNFTIIILDKDLNIIGETKFPDYTYNSQLIFIREDGIYISDSHYLNPNFNDDILSFKRFDLKQM